MNLSIEIMDLRILRRADGIGLAIKNLICRDCNSDIYFYGDGQFVYIILPIELRCDRVSTEIYTVLIAVFEARLIFTICDNSYILVLEVYLKNILFLSLATKKKYSISSDII